MKQMTDAQVLSKVKGLARKERAITLHLLLYLNEVERRELYAPMGYSTMFAYLTRHLLYSESGASRRLRVARCFRDYPELVGMFRRREVSMSTVLAVSGALTTANRDTLIDAIRGRSRPEVDMLVAAEKPPTARMADSIRPVVVKPRPAVPRDGNRSQAELLTASTPPTPAPAPANEPVEEMRVIRFTATPEFEKKLHRVRALLSTRYPNATGLEQAITEALDVFLDKHDPARRKARRDRRVGRKVADAVPREAPHAPDSDRQPATRHLPAHVRDEVSTRDGGRCTFVGADGTRCGSRHNIQIDHIQPFALGGSSDSANLRVLCAKHNRLLAKGMFGAPVGNSAGSDRPRRAP